MQVNPELVVYAVIFVAVLVLVEGIYLTVFGRSISLNSRVNRRLALLEKGGPRSEVLEQLRKEMGQHLGARRIPVYALLADKAKKAAIAFSPAQLVMLMVLVSVLGLRRPHRRHRDLDADARRHRARLWASAGSMSGSTARPRSASP